MIFAAVRLGWPIDVADDVGKEIIGGAAPAPKSGGGGVKAGTLPVAVRCHLEALASGASDGDGTGMGQYPGDGDCSHGGCQLCSPPICFQRIPERFRAAINGLQVPSDALFGHDASQRRQGAEPVTRGAGGAPRTMEDVATVALLC